MIIFNHYRRKKKLIFFFFPSIESPRCCFSLGYNDTRSPHSYRVSVNASHVDSRKHNNEYVVMISYPAGYIVQDDPSSPYSYVSCIRKNAINFTYQCDSKDKLTFYVEMTMAILQFPANNTLSATVYIFGDQCNQQDDCPDLAALAAISNDDKVSLGPLGNWSKVGVALFGCALAFLLLIVCFVIIRRNSIATNNTKYSNYQLDVHEDPPNENSPSNNENDDNNITQMPLKDNSTNLGERPSYRNLHSSTIEKSSSNNELNNINRSESQRISNIKRSESQRTTNNNEINYINRSQSQRTTNNNEINYINRSESQRIANIKRSQSQRTTNNNEMNNINRSESQRTTNNNEINNINRSESQRKIHHNEINYIINRSESQQTTNNNEINNINRSESQRKIHHNEINYIINRSESQQTTNNNEINNINRSKSQRIANIKRSESQRTTNITRSESQRTANSRIKPPDFNV
ncbi:GTP-binding protein Obg [Gigaspora margarita]|uniref:GTP-binding protein Obg n=1 Tax=Gigaspora margarita TaxID=4874 RepID=A0A8H4AUA9_GIGMA|nr:GTP-binding protein Obg [Gigaspora margarita]